MPITCPACNKANQSAAACQRCACDLTQLLRIEQSATAHLGSARAAMAVCDWAEALAWAERSWRLQNRPEAARVAFLAALGAGDTLRGTRWRRRAQGAESASAQS